MEIEEQKVEYKGLLEEIGSRKFYGFPDLWSQCPALINTEYQFSVDTCREYIINRLGGILQPTSETIPIGIKGRLLLRPDKVWAEPIQHSLHVNYSPDGSIAGASVNPGSTRLEIFHLERKNLADLLNSSFPYLSLQGKITLSTTKPLPGDTSRKVFSDLVIDAIKKNSEFARLSKAHHSFLDSYLGKREENKNGR